MKNKKKAKVCGYSAAIVMALAIVAGCILSRISGAKDIWLGIIGMTFILGLVFAMTLFFLGAYITTRPEKKKERSKIAKIEASP